MNLTFWIIFLGMSVGGPLLAMIGGTWLGNKWEDRCEAKRTARHDAVWFDATDAFNRLSAIGNAKRASGEYTDHWAANNYR